jgi:hypothetical protein
MFRRRHDQDPADEPAGQPDELTRDAAADDEAAYSEQAAQPGEPAPAAGQPAPGGPWDISQAQPDDTPRLDLGALLVPAGPGVEVRVEVDPGSRQVVAATLVVGHSQIQIGVFAAPKSAGIWADVRGEIATSLRQSGGSAEEVAGRFGPELVGTSVAEVPGQGRVQQRLRFIGVDGPRWFLRGLIAGPAATEAGERRRLEDLFAGVVVNRGGEAMAPRDPLPLTLPREAREALGIEQPATEGRPVMDVYTRGPEITETR